LASLSCSSLVGPGVKFLGVESVADMGGSLTVFQALTSRPNIMENAQGKRVSLICFQSFFEKTPKT